MLLPPSKFWRPHFCYPRPVVRNTDCPRTKAGVCLHNIWHTRQWRMEKEILSHSARLTYELVQLNTAYVLERNEVQISMGRVHSSANVNAILEISLHLRLSILSAYHKKSGYEGGRGMSSPLPTHRPEKSTCGTLRHSAKIYCCIFILNKWDCRCVAFDGTHSFPARPSVLFTGKWTSYSSHMTPYRTFSLQYRGLVWRWDEVFSNRKFWTYGGSLHQKRGACWNGKQRYSAASRMRVSLHCWVPQNLISFAVQCCYLRWSISFRSLNMFFWSSGVFLAHRVQKSGCQ
jgi:hypothetical protein